MLELISLLGSIPQTINAGKDLVALIQSCFAEKRDPTPAEMAAVKARLDANLALFHQDAGMPAPPD